MSILIALVALGLGFWGIALCVASSRREKAARSSDPASVPAECVTAASPRKRYDRAQCEWCGRTVAITAAGNPHRGRHRCRVEPPQDGEAA